MNDLESRQEKYMKRVVELLHKVPLTLFDVPGRTGAVDYVFSSSQRGEGAVEVTTIRDEKAAAWELLLDSDAKTIECASSRSWALTVELKTKRAELEKRIPRVVDLLDCYAVDDPLQLPVEEWSEDVLWLLASQNRLRPTGFGPVGTVRVDLPAQVGLVDDEGTDRDLSRVLGTNHMQSKASKLMKHPDINERHLAVGVAMYGPGFTLLNQLMFDPGRPPSWDPRQVLEGVTHIWLSGGTRDVLAWDLSTDWHWRQLPASSE